MVDPACKLSTAPTTVRGDGAAVLQVWQIVDEQVLHRPVLPEHDAFLAYRAAIRADGAALRRPIADEPQPDNDEQARMWRDERFNNDLAQRGEVGDIAPITCLDGLFFAHQHARFSQLTQPTEFLLSVMRKDIDGRPHLLAIFGASDQMFPDKRFYGFDVVDEYLAQGWSFWYMLHNHTVQKRGARLALGSPVLSTADVHLVRNLASGRGLQSARVTNGFYTFTAPAADFGRLRARE